MRWAIRVSVEMPGAFCEECRFVILGTRALRVDALDIAHHDRARSIATEGDVPVAAPGARVTIGGATLAAAAAAAE